MKAVAILARCAGRSDSARPPPLQPEPDAGKPAPAPPPMLATPVEHPFSREGWVFELKYDGVRAMVSVAGDAVRITGRRGNDETTKYPEATAIRAGIHARQAILDGELVVLDAGGRPSFERLQQRINVSREPDVRRVAAEHPVTFVAFDLLQLEGRDLTGTDLRIRKKTLRETVVDSPYVLFAEHVERDGMALFEEARSAGIEGIVGKRADSLYRPGIRSPDWVKIKSWRSQSCVIAGYTAGRGKRSNQLGALILAITRRRSPRPLRPGGHRFRREDVARPEGSPRTPHRRNLPARHDAQDRRARDVGETRAGLRSPLLGMDTRRHPPPPRLPHAPPRPAPRRLHPRTTATGTSAARSQTGQPRLQRPRQRSDFDNEKLGRRQPRRSPALSRRNPEATAQRSDFDKEESGWLLGGSAAGAPGDEDASQPNQTDKPQETGSGGGEGSPDGPTGPGASGPGHRRGELRSPDIAAALAKLRTLKGNAHWEIAGRRLPLTNLDKILWPADGITKRDMIEYYVRMAGYMLPYLRDRPLSMQVFPDGIDGKSFWRKDKPAHAPAWIDSWTYHGEKTKTYILVNEVATLAWVANAGVIDLHPWHSRADAPGEPDWAVFDLDPFEPATFQEVVDIAKLVKAALDHYRMHGVVKTSGQTGLQIYVPVRRGPEYGAVRHWVEEVGRAIDQAAPGRVSWEWAVAKRTGRIRIDYTQNIINKTLAAPYSLRPAPGAPVSTPIAWEELDDPDLRPDRWNITTIADRVAETGDLFAPVLDADQDLPGDS